MTNILSFIAVALFIIGIAGNGFEMRKIRMSLQEEMVSSKNVFLDKRNFKWYMIIGIAIALWALRGIY